MKIRAIVATIALLGAVTACSSEPGTPAANDDAAVAQSTADLPPNSDADSGDASTMTSEAAAADDSDSDEDAAGSDSDSGGAAVAGSSDFCQQLLAAEKKLDGIDDALTGNDPTQATKVVATALEVFQQLAKSAPSEVASDLNDIVAALTSAQQALSGGASGPSAVAGLTKLANDVNSLGNYVANNCYMDAGATG